MSSYNLFSQNHKLSLQNGAEYLITGLAMAPHNIGGHNVCESSTISCVSACVLWLTGRTVTQGVRRAMIRRKMLFFEQPEEFYRLLRDDVIRHRRAAEKRGLKPVIRLNVASDLDYSRFVRDYPDIQFYDYTKVRSRLLQRNWPTNYHLTYSVSERSHWRTITAQLDRGRNVAAIFSTRYSGQHHIKDALPTSWRFGGREWPIVDGDNCDVRLPDTDGQGVIVGLRFKGSLARRARAMDRGFCLTV